MLFPEGTTAKHIKLKHAYHLRQLNAYELVPMKQSNECIKMYIQVFTPAQTIPKY